MASQTCTAPRPPGWPPEASGRIRAAGAATRPHELPPAWPWQPSKRSPAPTLPSTPGPERASCKARYQPIGSEGVPQCPLRRRDKVGTPGEVS